MRTLIQQYIRDRVREKREVCLKKKWLRIRF
jgi:hypothetical protein